MEQAASDGHEAWAELYDLGLPEVYGYLLHRCGSSTLAQNLTGETFLAVARAARSGAPITPSIAWVITVARNKLIDHWRRAAVEERALRVLSGEGDTVAEQWTVDLDGGTAMEVLHSLPAHHQAILTSRYVDGLSTAEAAELLGRSVQATQALLVRARADFRRRYEAAQEDQRRG